MNKLVNLIIIFLTLQYLVPLISNFELLKQNHLYMNIYAALIVGVIQFIYNLGMSISKTKHMTIKENFNDSIFKMLIVVGGFYIYSDMKYEVSSLKLNNLLESSFITLLITFFILIKCLITP